MNLFLDYKNIILYHLRYLKDEKIINLPDDFKNLTVELPPKNKKSDLSCNVALVLANFNNKSPMEFAAVLKPTLLKKFKEFKEIEIAKPGFLNISLKEDFWKNYLQKIKLTNDTTDTKILINLYENLNSNLIPKLLNGMFAYVMYDKLKDKLTIVNDVQGDKNLYYYDDDNILLISSTIQAFLNFRKKFRINI